MTCWLTQAMSGWAQKGWAMLAHSSRGGTSCRWCLAASHRAHGRRWYNWVGNWTLVCTRQKTKQKVSTTQLHVFKESYQKYQYNNCQIRFTPQGEMEPRELSQRESLFIWDTLIYPFNKILLGNIPKAPHRTGVPPFKEPNPNIFYCKEKHANIPFSNSSLLFISECVFPEWQHHKLGTIYEHHSAAVLWIDTNNGDMDILHETIL